METKKNNNEFLIRTLSATVFGGLMVCSMLFFPIFFGIVFLVFMIVALSEFYHISIGNLFPIPQTCAFFTAIVFFVLIFLYNCIGLSGRWLWATIIPLALVQITTIFLSVNERRELSRFPYIYYGLGYIALPFSLSSFLAFRNGEFNCMLLLCFFILIWMNDIGAYLLGSTLGQRPDAKKLAPSISPRKSWVGFWSGMVFCVGSAIALKYIGLLDLPIVHAIALGVIICVGGVCGDLFESIWKRYFGVKDSGHCIPGHGGMLDRFDSALVAIPLATVYLALFGIL